MLSPGEIVRIDGGKTNWKIIESTRRGDLNADGIAVWPGQHWANYYKLEGWPNPDEEIPASRITGVVSHG